MTPPTALRLSHLALKDFRCFKELQLSFEKDLTVLVAQNGQGKTAILDAIAKAFSLFVDTVAGTSQWHGFDRRDVRLIPGLDGDMKYSPFVQFEADGFIADQHIAWRRWMKGDSARARTSTKDTRPYLDAAEIFAKELTADHELQSQTPLPLIAYYGTDRRWSDDNRRSKKPVVTRHERCIGYVDCLQGAASYSIFSSWYEDTFQAAGNLPVFGSPSASRPEKLLAAVEEAMRQVLEPQTGWMRLHWNFEHKQLEVEHPRHGRLPLAFLSDGVRNTVALVADIAHRCARLNPHLGVEAARGTPGILLIDEVDLHLHPIWQQHIIRLLREAFPAMQLIASTHSPQVLSTVDRDSIRVVQLVDGIGQIKKPPFQTKGVESADVLAKVMDVDPVPQIEEAQWLSDYRAKVQMGEYETKDAIRLWETITSHFGQEHPVLSEIAILRRLQDFKRLHKLPLSDTN